MSSSVSPDGTHLAALLTDGNAALSIVDLKTWKVQQLVGDSALDDQRISGNDVGQEGPTYSPDGSQLWPDRTDGCTKFSVNPDSGVSDPVNITIPADGPEHALVGAAPAAPSAPTSRACPSHPPHWNTASDGCRNPTAGSMGRRSWSPATHSLIRGFPICLVPRASPAT